MCTVSWTHEPGGYQLLCNRDEKRSRGIAHAPRLQQRLGVRYLAPADSDFGGTWIAANEHGITACLLNRHGAARGERSRGLIIPELIWARSADDCAFLMRDLDLPAFAPFTLLLLEPDRPALIADWDGRRLAFDPHGDGRMPLTSSSFDAEGVRQARLLEFARHRGDLATFHASHGDSPSAYSPCMHRDDAETVSFTWAVVSTGAIRLAYVPEAPCRHRGELTWTAFC
jgi:hypothetical protein